MKRYCWTLLWLLMIIQTAYPCSSFVLKNGKTILLGKNFDWTFEQGYLIKNLRNVHKFAYFSHEGQAANWTSKYGSITFNQNGKEMPYGGMNEKGLVVEMLWLEDTRFNIGENRAYLNELEWIQYQLDNFQSVDEVIAHVDHLKIYPIKGKIHYILADGRGKSVIIEYLAGKPNIYEKDANTCQAITNKTVSYSEKFIDHLQGTPKRNTSETYRYHQLEKQISNLKNPADFSEKTAFGMLKSVAIPKGDFKTVWSIVYNIENKSISFLTSTNKKIKQIDLKRLDFERELSFYNMNQNTETVLHDKLNPFSEPENLSVLTASLTHLGFDEALCEDLSSHQFRQISLSESEFSKNYFHFDISLSIEEEGNFLIFAVMDSEENFVSRRAVTGGYVAGNTSKGVLNRHIYGLKNGTYALAVLLDENRNKQLDFDAEGNPTEKYATFSDKKLKSPEEVTFENTSNYFDGKNSVIAVKWK